VHGIALEGADYQQLIVNFQLLAPYSARHYVNACQRDAQLSASSYRIVPQPAW
jgi:hypothetical protein